MARIHDRLSSKPGPVGFRWLIETFGSNYRMTEIEAAIGLRQLQRLPLVAGSARRERRHL